ncbi:MAG: hypothetical protein CMF74_10965 [Maricaulis sp.]|jgi:putative salt-induced outer membrane protein YdiY|nr:hypothetical protein [Maricaulis sp.]HAQ36657.1 hypothetical protein [Alphaproteobacteria bacterium]
MYRFACSLVLAVACLFAAPHAAAQDLPEPYVRLIADAATYDDGANFDAVVMMVARNAEGGDEAVMAAVRQVAPQRSAQASAALGQAGTMTLADNAVRPEPATMAMQPVEADAAAAASPAAPEIDPGWTGRVSAGLSVASGNSEQQTYNLGAELNREFANGWTFDSRINYAYAESAGAVTQDQLALEARGDRSVSERWGYFIGGQYDRDVLSSFDWTAFVSAGATFQAIERETLDWSLRAGPGVRYLMPATGSEETQFVVDLGSDLEWQITPDSVFISETTLLVAESSRAEQSFRFNTSVADNWAVEFEWRYRYEFEPLPGFEESDSRVTASLVREF